MKIDEHKALLIGLHECIHFRVTIRHQWNIYKFRTSIYEIIRRDFYAILLQEIIAMCP